MHYINHAISFRASCPLHSCPLKSSPAHFPMLKLQKLALHASLASRRGRDKRDFRRRATLPYSLQYFASSVHVLPHIVILFCHILPHVVISWHILPTFSHEHSWGWIAALLRRPRLSRPRLEAGELGASIEHGIGRLLCGPTAFGSRQKIVRRLRPISKPRFCISPAFIHGLHPYR